MHRPKTLLEAPLSYGPLRHAPKFYVGEFYGRHRIQYPDVERHPNGALAGERNKAARRIIRGALKRKFSRLETALHLPRAMQAQAREIAGERPAVVEGSRAWNGKSPRWARRLYTQELALHTPVYCPDQKELRRMRTEKRKAKRAGKLDAISQLVDKMATP